jgi:hypothetical protein
MLEDATGGVGVGSSARKKFKQYVAQFVSDEVESEEDEIESEEDETESEEDEIESEEDEIEIDEDESENEEDGIESEENAIESEEVEVESEENATESKDDEASLSESGSEQELEHPEQEAPEQDLAEPSSHGTGNKRKGMLDDEDGDPELSMIVKRKREDEPELTKDSNKSSFSKASRPPVVISRPMQKKLDYSLKQQAFYRSAVSKRSGRPLRNAVLEKIAELEEAAEKKKTKEIAEAKEAADEKLKKGDQIAKTTHVKDTKQLAGDDDLKKKIVETQREEVKASVGGKDALPQIKGPTPEKGKKKPRLTYAEKLRKLPTKLPTQDQRAALEHSKSTGPKYLGRTASTVHGYRHAKQWMTNGSTSQDLLLPSADSKKGYESHRRLTDLSQGEMIYMCGLHLTWLDPKHDEFLSYSKELLFLLIHALGRDHTGQRNVTIQYINRDEATTLEGEPAAFYDALDIYNIFEVPSWSGWSIYLDLALNPRKFTHEFLSHGIIKHNDNTFKQARLEDLIGDGLFVLFPELEAPDSHERSGLYTEQVVCRRIGFPPREALAGESHPPLYSYDDCPRPVAFTTDTLTLARKLALNFITVPAGTDPSTVEPPLHIFLQFLSLHKRVKADPLFTAWIQQHYNGKRI